jgi:hypothetical protein
MGKIIINQFTYLLLKGELFMIITDLEHIEAITLPSEQVKGSGFSLLFPVPFALPGRSIARFNFNSLATGSFGASAGGEPEILTVATDEPTGSTYSVGFKFSYQAEAIGYPILEMGGMV